MSHAQPGKRKAVGAGAAVVIAASMLFIKPWEGRELVAYRDIVNVWTICDGVTAGVKPGQVATNAECDRLLQDEVGKHYAGVMACISRPVTQNQAVALVAWTYNVGIRAACGSTLVRMLNQGEPAAVWCRQLLRWDRAGGKQVRGLTRRREAELKVCLTP